MKPIFKHLILLLILAGVYFAADFLEKGIILNDITPYPILGIVFWVLLLYIVFVVVIQPIIQFRKLKTINGGDVNKAAKKLHKQLEAYKFKDKNNEENWQSRIWHDINEILLTKPENDPERKTQLAALIEEYVKTDNQHNGKAEKAKKIINKYSWSAALCVVFSRNSFLDGLLILFAQLNMTVEIAKLYGYKPSPMFNTLCFCWIATNSIITGLFSQAGAQAVGDVFADSLTNGDIVEGGLTSTLLSKTSGMVVEGLAAATTVYVTGNIVLLHLQGIPEIQLETLFRLRRRGRIELLKEIPRNVAEKLKGSIPWFSKAENQLAAEPLTAL
ncbi:MAG: DUF697 domain-containing protein [Bacteroidales bacterium]|nr:DUF697 domain-containing protein [Bacteroidales bacterium]